MTLETAIIGLLLATTLILGGAVWLLLRQRASLGIDPDSVARSLSAQLSQMSFEALRQAQTSFLEVAETRFQSLREAGAADLDGRKSLIDRQLHDVKTELGKVSTLVNQLEKDREQKFGELAGQLKAVSEGTATLNATAGQLRQALANSRVRGQWGERMAEDVLRLCGFIEGVNYEKQKTQGSNGSRPDFTFLLPRNLKLNMDVKFPLENYLKCVGADNSQPDQARFLNAFLGDVRGRLRELVGRDYIDPQQNTLPYVLMFIPNEQVYQFIQEHDRLIIDECLKNRVVLCSPMTLFAILLLIREAIDNFSIEQASNQIIQEMGVFKREWDNFLGQLDTVNRRIESTQKEYQTLVTTRRRALERPLQRIEVLRRERGLGLPEELVSINDAQLDLDFLDDEQQPEDKL